VEGIEGGEAAAGIFTGIHPDPDARPSTLDPTIAPRNFKAPRNPPERKKRRADAAP